MHAPVPQTHDLARVLLELIARQPIPSRWQKDVQQLAEDSALARALNLLADLAFYTGVGRKTTQGMGMTRRIEFSAKE